jgi:hypothetical protein
MIKQGGACSPRTASPEHAGRLCLRASRPAGRAKLAAWSLSRPPLCHAVADSWGPDSWVQHPCHVHHLLACPASSSSQVCLAIACCVPIAAAADMHNCGIQCCSDTSVLDDSAGKAVRIPEITHQGQCCCSSSPASRLQALQCAGLSCWSSCQRSSHTHLLCFCLLCCWAASSCLDGIGLPLCCVACVCCCICLLRPLLPFVIVQLQKSIISYSMARIAERNKQSMCDWLHHQLNCCTHLLHAGVLLLLCHGYLPACVKLGSERLTVFKFIQKAKQHQERQRQKRRVKDGV